MRTAMFTLVRLGPSLAYATAAVFLISMLLLEYSPSSASAWWLYMAILPLMREPIYLLFAVPGVGIWIATVLLNFLLALRDFSSPCGHNDTCGQVSSMRMSR